MTDIVKSIFKKHSFFSRNIVIHDGLGFENPFNYYLKSEIINHQINSVKSFGWWIDELKHLSQESCIQVIICMNSIF